MKLPTLFVPIIHEYDNFGKPQKLQLISAKRVKEITDKLPEKEVILEHLKLEKYLIDKAEQEGGKHELKPYEVIVTKDNFQSEVLESNVVVLADFWAPWCAPCRMMEPILKSIAEENQGKIKVVKINVDEEEELAVKFGITSIPSLFVFHKGEIADKRIGAVSRQVLYELINNYS